MTEIRVGSIEAGGTKFILAVLDENFKILVQERIPTTGPQETLEKCCEFFLANRVDALGIGSFGPIGVNQSAANYGKILTTPKAGWSGVDVVGKLKNVLHVPLSFTTDVNASAYGEYVLGAGKEVGSLAYFTVGTGIGGAVVQDGRFIGGISHSEMGHATVIQHPDDHFAGGCPFHQNHCFEGLAAGPTIEARTGVAGELLPRDHEVFKFISYYAAQIAFNAFVNFAPARIVFGGSVLSEAELPAIRKYLTELNNGYVEIPDLGELVQLSHITDNGSATVGNGALALEMLRK